MGESERGIRPSVLALLVAVVAMLAFAPALGGSFLYDDRPLIATNPYVHELSFWKRWFVTDFWNLDEDFLRTSSRIVYWRPLVTATYALEWKLGHGSPTLFHAINLLWHALVGWLAFRALRRWTDTIIPAFVAALFFAVHPTKAESVAWIAGRTDVLCMAAMFLVAEGVALRLRATAPGARRKGIALEIFGTLLAYGTKEQAITLAVLVAVESWVHAGRPALDRATITRAVRAALPQLGIAIVYLALRQRLMPVRPRPFSTALKDWAAMLFETWGRYFELTVFPHDLSVQQGLVQAEGGRLHHSTPYIVAGVLGLIALIALMVACAKKRPLVSVGIAFYLGMILPTSNLVPTGMITLLSERFLYVPMLGIALVLASVLAESTERVRRVAPGLASLAVVLLAVVAARRSADFIDEDAFWKRERRLHPESLEALGAIKGKALLERRYRDALVAAAALHQVCKRYYAYTGSEIDIIVESVEILSFLTPDGDRTGLEAYADFLGHLVDGTAEPTLERPGVRIIVPRNKASLVRIESVMFRIHTMRASILSRLGRDADALASSEAAIQNCPRCASVHRDAIAIRARAGDFLGAQAAADEAAKWSTAGAVAPIRASVQSAYVDAQQANQAEGVLEALLRARSLARLEAWGRAYALLVPHRAMIEKAPGLAFTYAELAYRSGDEKSARAVLALVRAPEAIEPTLKDWARKMGW